MPPEKRENKTYASIIGGRIAIKAQDGAEGAVSREVEDKKTGVKSTKWEYIYDNLRGYITSIKFVDGDYGQQIQIEIDGYVLSVNTDSSYGQDIMKKLPNVKLDQEVNFVPWNMEKDGKTKKGVVVYQGRTDDGKTAKVSDFFYNFETKEYFHGFPESPKETKDNDDWVIYFKSVKRFLVEYITKNILPKVEETSVHVESSDEEQGIDIEDIPFNTDTEPSM